MFQTSTFWSSNPPEQEPREESEVKAPSRTDGGRMSAGIDPQPGFFLRAFADADYVALAGILGTRVREAYECER